MKGSSFLASEPFTSGLTCAERVVIEARCRVKTCLFKKTGQLGTTLVLRSSGSGEIHPKSNMGSTSVSTGLSQSSFLSHAKFNRVISPSREKEERDREECYLVLSGWSLKGKLFQPHFNQKATRWLPQAVILPGQQGSDLRRCSLGPAQS